jgi:hypothetical protein
MQNFAGVHVYESVTQLIYPFDNCGLCHGPPHLLLESSLEVTVFGILHDNAKMLTRVKE